MPYSAAAHFSRLSQDVSVVQALIGFVILFPILFLAIIPYFIIIIMIIDTYNLDWSLLPVKLAFFLSAWAFLLLLYYIVMNGIVDNRRQNHV